MTSYQKQKKKKKKKKKKNNANVTKLVKSKGNINGEIELYSSRSLQNPGFMALALIALEKQS